MMGWRHKADWQSSSLARLPAIGDSSSRSERAWLILAGGLALILSRAAEVADPMTAAAAKACFAATLGRTPPQQDPARKAQTGGIANPGTSPISPDSSRHAETTKSSLELLFERSIRLRETVAWARTTTFGNPDAKRS